jgi:dipeptidyl-peptidase-4
MFKKLVWAVVLGLSLITSSRAQEKFMKWVDGDHYIMQKSVDGETLYFTTHVLTNEQLPFEGNPYASTFMRGSRSTKLMIKDSAVVQLKEHDLFLQKKDGTEIQLTSDEGIEKNARLSDDSSKIAYTKDHNLYVLSLSDYTEQQLTFDGNETIYNGWASWVYYEEILGRASRYRAFWWSPDSKHIAFLQFNDQPVPTFPIFRSEGQHGALETNHYPKAGDPNPDVRMGIVNIESKNIQWIEEDKGKDQYTAWPFWTPDASLLFFQELNRGQDTLRIFTANPVSGEKSFVYEEVQPSWVNFYKEIDFLRNGKEFILRSEKNGWHNLYHYTNQGTLINQITEFPWRITRIVKIDESEGKIFFSGTGPVPTDQHLFSVNLDGSNLVKMTQFDGYNTFSLSPSGKYAHVSYNSLEDPGKTYICDENGEVLRILDEAENVNREANIKVESIKVNISDGFELPGYWVLPKGFDPAKKYPVVFSVYGGPNAGSVQNRYRNQTSDFYANNGIIRISIDHRASGKFGKKGLDYMHRNLGKYEIDDLIEVVKWLYTKPFVDQNQIGITGGSYGGYVTCMALTYGADYFTHGVSLFPVTDWSLYDNVYTERYMDTPAENPDGYRFGSAMTHVDKYKGNLLIIHGAMDDNVHMQNTMQLVSALQDKGKAFEMMLYPGERHGWGGPKRQHLTNLTEQFWKKHYFRKESVQVRRP